jgi:hypothetical protein
MFASANSTYERCMSFLKNLEEQFKIVNVSINPTEEHDINFYRIYNIKVQYEENLVPTGETNARS